MHQAILDRIAIRELIENWAVWRDAGDWERFATCWHDDGVMMATWFQRIVFSNALFPSSWHPSTAEHGTRCA